MSTQAPGVAGQVSNTSHDPSAQSPTAPPDRGKRIMEWMAAFGAFAAVGGGIAALVNMGNRDTHQPVAASATQSTPSPINITVTNTNNSSASATPPAVYPPTVAPPKVVTPQLSPAPIRTISAYERYINANASRVAGTLNVALALRGLPGHPPTPLEGAMERALLDRGMSIVPLFREAFQKDGMGRGSTPETLLLLEV